MPRRNPEATRARILAAAEELFAAGGFAGTRIDAVAARSGANKRMIYHYFGGKEALFEAVLLHRLAELPWTGDTELNADTARLIAWEGLEWGQPVAAAERGAAMRGFIDGLRARMTERPPGGEVDAALLALALVSARLFPLIAPRFAALIDGGRPDFEARYRAVVRTLVDALGAATGAPPTQAPKPRLTLRPMITGAD